jgi:hypothetical protein
MNLADRLEARGAYVPLDRCDSRDRGAMRARARVYVNIIRRPARVCARLN